ncbi:WxL domain-containing protein [Carnobacterium gallinarum]|uniref:WxL domain-containing protein n=1 Tax=Carnobacterium gallinarum TaxID=2749 RepID=UPI0005586A21|nr:WxL domain-containing protein [Carnobacterium gallinarum]
MVVNLKKLINMTALASLGLLLTSPPIVIAAEGGTIDNDADLGFIENTDSTNPVDPSDPSKPIKPTKPPTPGPLALNYASDIVFGSHDLSEEEVTFYALLDKATLDDGTDEQIERPNFIEMTDNRGTNSGWRLTVKQNGKLKNANGTELIGAFISLQNTEIVTLDEVNSAPTGIKKESIPISDSHEALVVNAEKGTGMGSWSVNFGSDATEGKSSISLFVPKDTPKEKGIYTTSLTWTLSDSI